MLLSRELQIIFKFMTGRFDSSTSRWFPIFVWNTGHVHTKQRAKPATSLDVALLAGVSRSTVSNILNGNDARFPLATRKRVHAAAKELAYRPSLAGRSLKTGRSDTVVVLLPNTTFFSNLQDTVDEAVAKIMPLGGNVVVRFGSESDAATLGAINALRPLAVLAFAPLSIEARAELEAARTIVVPGRIYPNWAESMPDGGLGSLQADRVLRRGARHLWFAGLSDRRQDVYGPGRAAALERYCSEKGLSPLRRVSVPLRLEGAVKALREIVSTHSGAVGVACYNDDVALALLSAARVLKINVPERLSIIGVDNTPVGQLWAPRLTTIDTDLPGLVAGYAAELQARLAGEEPWLAAPPPHNFKVIDGETT